MTWVPPAASLLALGILSWLELRRPLRASTEAKGRHVARNLGLAAVWAGLMPLLQLPLILPLAELTRARGWGLLGGSEGGLLASLAALVLLDYTFWWWHWLNHRVPWLWRFHLVHHVDRDLDASTALRFHVGEMVVAFGWRAGQILLIGPTPQALALSQLLLPLSTLFHHSNVRLPESFERGLSWLVVTPRMHGIHHSDVREESRSNLATILSLWDRLHGTCVPQERHAGVIIGVPAWRRPDEITLGRLLVLPFRRQREDWHG